MTPDDIDFAGVDMMPLAPEYDHDASERRQLEFDAWMQSAIAETDRLDRPEL